MLRDLRHAARLLLRTKGWTAVVLLSLALGIGANTALFSAVNGLLLRTIPVLRPDALVRVKWAGKNEMVRSTSDYGYSAKNPAGEDVRPTVSYAVFQALRSANQTMTDLLAAAPIGGLNVVVNGHAELATAFIVSGNYFRLLEVPAIAGRTITPDDDQASAAPVAMISHGYWSRRFSLDPSVVGQVVTLNDTQVTIVGVTPPGFTGIQSVGDSPPEITVPLVLDPRFSGNTRLQEATWWWLEMMGRLKPGSTPAQVRGNLDGVFQQTTRDGWSSYLASITAQDRLLSQNQNRTAVPHLDVDSGSRGVYDVDQGTTRSAAILSVVVALVLLIVCANVANLLLSRAAARQKEISVRMSLGATRFRLVRQLLMESLLLAFLGGALGILVGYWSRQLLPFGQEAPLDWHVFAFAAGLCLVTGVAFGFVPALRATRVDVSGSLKETSRGVSRSHTLLGKSLLVVQVAVTLVLLIGAGLFLRTLQNLRRVEVGFNTQNLVVFSVNPRLSGYDAARASSLYDQIEQSLGAVPGVRSVSFSQSALLAGSVSTSRMFIHGRPPAGPDGLRIWMMTVSPGFFDTLGIPVLRGRGFAVRDMQPTAPAVAVINEAAARQYFGGEDPLGRRFGFSPETTEEVEVVGLLRDTKYASVRDAAPPTAYRPFPQQSPRGATFEVRTSGAPTQAIPAVREAVRRVDANLPLIRVSTQAQLVEGRITPERFFAMSYSLFGGLALVVACIGLFGLMSYSVARRTNEIGIRMALGAQRGDVVRMVLGESLIMVAVGVAIGLSVALAAGRLITSLLFGLTPTDALTIAAAVALLVVVSALAGYLPARRASRVDPMIALHYE